VRRSVSGAVRLRWPDTGPLDPVVVRVHALLVDGRLEAVVRESTLARRVAEALGDHVSCLFLDYLSGQALLELDRSWHAGQVARRLLIALGPGGDRFWRAKALALSAAAEVDRGAILPALEALAEALAIVEERPPRRYHHVSASSAVAGVLMKLLLFEPAAELIVAATRGAVARGGDGSLLGAGAAVQLVRRLAEVHALWATQLDLLSEPAEAAEHHRATVSAALWMRRLAVEASSPALIGCAEAVEAFATERLGDPDLPRARARAALATAPRPDALVEWLPGRVALARAAAAAGELAEARVLLAEVDRACTTRHRDVWAGLVQVAVAEVEELAEAQEGAADHPAGEVWREVAASGLRRIWQERDARLADLRHRILHEELDRRSRQTRRRLFVDPLTGLGNRRRLEQEIDAGTGTAAALFLDIDNFKMVNDRAGHAVGDEVLRRMAVLLRRNCRSGDVLVRYGGDEFVVLLNAPAGASRLGERLVTRVREEDWRPITGGMDITVSVGVAVGGASALRRSDAALRLAKRSGRDAVVQL
jgi:diguanylate cyclase (GGDEF)-like protein